VCWPSYSAPWLSDNIAFNTDKRKRDANDFEKNFFKLKNNNVFGKTIENLRKRVNIELVSNEKRLIKLIKSPSFNLNISRFSHLILRKLCLCLNLPIYVGFTILELSKVLMYSFHYKYVKEKYKSQAKLLSTDTYSLTYQIATEEIYHDMATAASLFDLPKGPLLMQYH